MDDNTIKEQLSNNFVSIIASYSGFVISKSDVDFGVDFTISKVQKITRNGQTKYLPAPEKIDIQMKSTTEKYVEFDENKQVVKYSLRTKNYNDMVQRNSESYINPLILILFVLPTDKNKWVSINSEYLSLQKCAYWYITAKEDTIVENENSTTLLKIPFDNMLTESCFEQLFEMLKQ